MELNKVRHSLTRLGIWYLCIGRGPLSISTKISASNYMWRHYNVMYVKTVKTRKKWQNVFFTVNFLGTSEFHWVCGKSFFKWLVNMNNKFGIKRKKKLYISKNSAGCTFPLYTLFWTTTLPNPGIVCVGVLGYAIIMSVCVGGVWGCVCVCVCYYNERKGWENNVRSHFRVK